jgi:NAD(P)-dependent dehydrogenase (short-subunit alcohol dehydrogenase family)
MFQPDILQDKVILVTGGGTGLGKSMGKRFLQLGAKLAIASRKEDVLAATAKELMDETGGEVFYASCDVRNPEFVDSLMDAVWKHYGTIDVLVNNAAGNFAAPTETLSHRAVDAVLNIVLHGTWYCTLALGKKWIAEKRGGTMLNIIATYAWTGAPFVAPSATAKAGVLALTQSLAVEWGRYGIRMNAIAPGPFPTTGAASRLSPTASFEGRVDGIPMRRLGEHEELANLASFLVSDYSGYINGDCITIDGGKWLQGAADFSRLENLTPEDWAQFAAQAKGQK